MSVNIVIVAPMIPQNTGNVARLSAANRTVLHLIEPLGFSLSDRYLKRAGLDYWSEVQLELHPSWEQFLEKCNPTRDQLWFLTTRGKRSHFEASFAEGDFLVFGNEVSGLPEPLYASYSDRFLRIPMENPRVRSLNLSSAVAAVFYEAKRQVATSKLTQSESSY